MSVILECDIRQLELTFSLNIDLLMRIDQNVTHGRILKERFQRTETENFVKHLVTNLLAFQRTQQRRLFVDQRHQRIAHFRAHFLILDRRQRLQIDLVQQTPVELKLQFLIFRIPSQTASGAGAPDAVLPSDIRSRADFLWCCHSLLSALCGNKSYPFDNSAVRLSPPALFFFFFSSPAPKIVLPKDRIARPSSVFKATGFPAVSAL